MVERETKRVRGLSDFVIGEKVRVAFRGRGYGFREMVYGGTYGIKGHKFMCLDGDSKPTTPIEEYRDVEGEITLQGENLVLMRELHPRVFLKSHPGYDEKRKLIDGPEEENVVFLDKRCEEV